MTNTPSDQYAKKKEYVRQRDAEMSRDGRDISPLPQVQDPQRKKTCARNFQIFCELYFPLTFNLAWSDDHLRIIHKIEQAVLHGGLFALAMPRGSGKTSLAECAGVWAMLYGHGKFICLIGSDEGAAVSMLESIKTELESNDLLCEDFPEVCYPIQRLEGIAHRCNGQLFNGERTQIHWTANQINLPIIPDSAASGSIIRVAGITGRIRGMKYKHPNGETLRPSLVIIDDPQTDESARSLSQCATRERTVAGAILGLAGPGKKIAGIMPCTVIAPGDMADRILDREKHPEWNGERTQLIESFPSNETLWETYADIRAQSLRTHGNIAAATAFYKKHQTDMDAGAIVSWKARYHPDELSAIQHAMNLKLMDEAAFWAEYQNEPLQAQLGGLQQLGSDEIARKLNGYASGVIPLNCNTLTMFIDVQGALLYYCICAWEPDFTGYVIDYGSFPEQPSRYFTLRDAPRTFAKTYVGKTKEASLYAGLEKLLNEKLGARWRREDGAELLIDRCMIDANWAPSTEVVYNFCTASPLAGRLLPSHGRYVGAASLPFSEYTKKRGDLIGHNWRLPSVKGKRATRYIIYDTNYWKTFFNERLCLALGNTGTLSLFGKDPEHHRTFSEHLSAEYAIETQGRGRTVHEWKIKPERADNHWFDCMVGCMVAASFQGIGLDMTNNAQRPHNIAGIKLSDLQKKKRRR
ncbi:MAG: phage terminase large subunit family protein [Planctomycetes bacterium]|nr:phage terminase large subunit family protein [Planctomycetota bacterium]